MKIILLILAVCVVVIMACVCFFVAIIGTPSQIRNRELDAYNAWVKITGNERRITIEEWRAMRNYGVLPVEVREAK